MCRDLIDVPSSLRYNWDDWRGQSPKTIIQPSGAIAVLMIGENSDVDMVQVATSDGPARILAVGVPLIGPFRGALVISDLRGVPSSVADPAAKGVTHRDGPRLEIIAHYAVPPFLPLKRAPRRRLTDSLTIPLTSEGTIEFIPCYGMRSFYYYLTVASSDLEYRIIGIKLQDGTTSNGHFHELYPVAGATTRKTVVAGNVDVAVIEPEEEYDYLQVMGLRTATIGVTRTWVARDD